MQNEKIKCPNCGNYFSWCLWGEVYPGCKDKEYVDCPHCGETYMTIMTSQYVSVQKEETPEKDKTLTLK